MSSSTASNCSLEESKTKSLHSLHRSIVTVYVGPEKYAFHFHKGRLCQHSPFFEKAFHGSFDEATTGSMYLGEDGVEEFKVFEEWIYSEQLSYPEDLDDASLLLVKVFCFADRVGIPGLQNDALDALRDRATGQAEDVSLQFQKTSHNACSKKQSFSSFAWGAPPEFETDPSEIIVPTGGKQPTHYLFPATSTAVHYAYQNTLEGSSLRKLLADMFAYNAKSGTLDEDILSFPVEFTADVLLINVKRLPLRLNGERADFDMDASRYHIPDSPNTKDHREQKRQEKTRVKGTGYNVDSIYEEPAEAAPVSESDMWGFGVSSIGKGKKGKRGPKTLVG